MTKKDYKAIASVINSAYEAAIQHENDTPRHILNRLTNRMASMLSEDNPRFDANLFWDACNPDSKE